MNDEDQVNPGHTNVRNGLRIAGPVILAIGFLFTAIGLISFFSSFGSFQSPRYFWCCFIGLPVMFVGIIITKVAYLGAVARYMAAETAPVGKDTFNYMASETKEGVRDVASAIKEGFSGEKIECENCQADNDRDATFCDQCGNPIAKSKACEACSALNDSGARFCDECGKVL